MRKPTICMGENKDADQLRGNCEADQRLCFRYTDSTFPPLLIPKFSRFWVSSVTVQASLCWTWSETQIVGFLMHRLIYLFQSLHIEAVFLFSLNFDHVNLTKKRELLPSMSMIIELSSLIPDWSSESSSILDWSRELLADWSMK